jgi:hypothetical protein
MKYRIYRITLSNGDWYEVAAWQKNWAIGVLAKLHFGDMNPTEFRRQYKPSARATGERSVISGPLRSNTYEH